MKQADTLPNRPPPLQSMDFGLMLDAGLQVCQELAGDQWTDYNEHDPGVTILEQLSYALTDLGYRTNYSVPDLLAPPPERDARQRARRYDTLYSGDSVLSAQPLTQLDYRKLIYDQMHDVHNVWVETRADGLYHIVVDSKLAHNTPDTLKVKLAEMYRKYRNLGEDLASVQVLKRVKVHVTGQLQVADHADPVEVMAGLLFRLQNLLAPYAGFVAVEDLLRHDVPPDAIFDGPLLVNGVLRDDELSDRPKAKIDPEELLRTILKMRGVVSVMELGMHRQDGKPLPLAPDECHELVLPKDGEEWQGLRVLWKGHSYKVDPARVGRRLGQLNGEVTHREAHGAQQQAAMAYRQRQEGRYRAVERYDSIQHQFPVTYGIGAFGVPQQQWLDRQERTTLANHVDPVAATELHPRTRRLAQAMQLKAYLLFFEQILANHGAQMANLGRLFSSDPQLDRTYFYAPLAHAQAQGGDVPDFLPLLMPPAPAPSPQPAPTPSEALRHVVLIRSRRRHHDSAAGPWPLLLRSRETGSAHQAELHVRDILEYGQRRRAFRRKRMRDGMIHLVLRRPDGQPLAFGVQRYRTRHAARRALLRVTAWIRRLAHDQEMRDRYVELQARGVLELALWNEAGVKLLSIGQLRMAELGTFGDEIIRAGQFLDRYEFPAGGHGMLKLRLGERGHHRHAEGHEHVCNREEAESAQRRLIAWLCKLEHDPALRQRYLRCDALPHPEPTPAPDPADPLRGYLQGVDRIARQFDPVLERRHQFLDHLLARFGEAFDDRALASFDPRQPAGGAPFSKELADWKARFLYHLAPQQQDETADDPRYNLAGRRSQGGGYANNAPSGLEQRLRLLLGIANGVMPAPLRVPDRRPQRQPQTDRLRQALERASSQSHKQDLFTYSAMSTSLLRRLLLTGTMLGGYEIASEAGQWQVTLVRRDHNGVQRRELLARSAQRQGAQAALDALIDALFEVTVGELEPYAEEDMSVLEHVLLRPRIEGGGGGLKKLEFQVSLVFPDWPQRFRPERWREFVFKTAAAQCPAHLKLQCYWLSPYQMTRFTQRRRAWHDALTELIEAEDKIIDAEIKIIDESELIPLRQRLDAAAKRLKAYFQHLDLGGR